MANWWALGGYEVEVRAGGYELGKDGIIRRAETSRERVQGDREQNLGHVEGRG